jgi:hypothetical protein
MEEKEMTKLFKIFIGVVLLIGVVFIAPVYADGAAAVLPGVTLYSNVGPDVTPPYIVVGGDQQEGNGIPVVVLIKTTYVNK